MDDLDSRWARLLDELRPHREAGVLVAFSGGLDSALLLDAAVEAVGVSRTVAFTAVSPSLAAAELASARAVAEELGVGLVEEETHELDDPGYVANAGDRCYFCKRELFSVLDQARARLLPGARVAYGYHRDDDGDHRPGLAAALEAGALRPLWSAHLRKADLRALARRRGRSFAEKASFACLSSRLPTGMTVTVDRLARVETIESWMRERGYRQFRARLVGEDGVRLQTEAADVPRLVEDVQRDAVSLRAVAASVGVSRIDVDESGYRRPGET